MPVKFRGVSEYASNFYWQPSYRSAQFQPTPQQVLPEAGMRSDQSYLLVEPAFMKKRQVPHRKPEAHECLAWWSDDEVANTESVKNLSDAKDLNSKTFVKSKNDVKYKASPKKPEKPNMKPPVKSKDKSETTVASDSRCTWEKGLPVSASSPSAKNAAKLKLVSSPSKKKRLIKAEKHSPKEKKKKPLQQCNETPKYQTSRSPKKETQSAGVPLKYRPLHSRMLSAHQSEYQQMYRKPKQFIPSSPLISALDVVYASSPAIPPHKTPKMFSNSEYSSQFKTQSALSKSVPNLSSPASPSLRLKVKNLPSSPYLHHHHHSPRRVESEYAMQFAEKGFPTELQVKVQDEAAHNKLNRDGTLFDKDHVNQLVSPNNKYWDLSSVSGSSQVTTDSRKTSSAVSAQREQAAVANTVNVNGKSNNERDVSQRKSSNDFVSKESASQDDDDDIESILEKDSLDTGSAASLDSLNCAKPLARKLAWDENGNLSDDEASTVVASVNENSEHSSRYEGRLPTPQLKDLGGALRTHHDRTTPCRGGALLTSPNRSPSRSPLANTSSEHQTPVKHHIKETPVKLGKTFTYSSRKKKEAAKHSPKAIKTTPTSITTKPNQIEQSSANAQKISQTMPEQSVPQLTKKPELPRRMLRVIRAPIQGALRSQEFQHCGNVNRPSADFDRISLRSQASAASTENLLQRSLQRKDFWQQK